MMIFDELAKLRALRDVGIALAQYTATLSEGEERIRPYEKKDEWYAEWFEPTLKVAQVQLVSWDAVLPPAD